MENSFSNLLLDLETERPISRRRETFLLSVIVHLMGIIFLITHPDMFSKLRPEVAEPVPHDVTLLYPPPERPKPSPPPEPLVLPKREPPTPSPAERPTPLALPYQLLEPPAAPKPRGSGGGKEELLARTPPRIGLPDFPEESKERSGASPKLEPVRPAEPPPSEARLQLPPVLSPGRGTEDILRGLAKERVGGGGQSLGKVYTEPGTGDSNFSIPGPQILSDTMGVDFDPYLMRVYLVVRRNWYSVIPEIARLGRQGKVVLQFSILQNGSVPDLVLTSGSGTESMDTAALASIRLSNPFPPLPAEFPGNDIRLRFVYLYNLPWNY